MTYACMPPVFTKNLGRSMILYFGGGCLAISSMFGFDQMPEKWKSAYDKLDRLKALKENYENNFVEA